MKVRNLKIAIMSFVLMLMLCVHAFADTQCNLTFKNKKETNTYSIYRLLNATTSSEDNTITEDTSISYTLNSKYETILKEITQKESEDDIISVIQNYSESEMKTFAKNVYSKILENNLEAEENGNGKTGFTNLQYGYYLIKDTSNDSEMKSENIIVSLLIKDLEIETKEDHVPGIEKKIIYELKRVDAITEEMNNDVTFEIKTDIPEKTDTYIIHDTLSNGFNKPENLTVKINHELQESVDYDIVDSPDDTCSFEIVFKSDVLSKNVGKKVTVTYTCKLNESALVEETNKAYLEYNNDQYSDSTSNTTIDENKVYTLQLNIKKVNEKNEALASARFKLFYDEALTNEVTLTKKDDIYYLDKAGNDEIVTLEDGLFKVIGLKSGTYYLQETVAPNGYKVQSNPIKIVIQTKEPEEILGDETLEELNATVTLNDSSIDVTTDKQTNSISFNVVNKSGIQLPTTGGVGTYIFYGIGIVMIGLSIIVWKKYKNK